jgi:hypothetical protein
VRTEVFICYSCGLEWRDTYSIWRGYCSPCPGCGKACQAFCDTEVFADQEEMAHLPTDYRSLHPNFEDDERTEADLDAERGQIRDEIVEALGAVASTSDTVEDSDADEDADDDGEDAAEGF